MTAGDATVKVGQDKTTIESVSPPRAPASPDHNGETEEKSVGLANGDATAASINVSNVPQPYQEDDHGNSENDADSEKKAAGRHKTSKSDNETTSEKEKDAKKDKESHKDPKKKHQASE